jgi:hypothetical protein
MDEQGAVAVEVKPVNLTNPGEATLTTDTGKTVQASQWDAPSGGHHVSGKLIFPASLDGKSFLEGAKKLTLTIKDLDAPERVFSWDLNL